MPDAPRQPSIDRRAGQSDPLKLSQSRTGELLASTNGTPAWAASGQTARHGWLTPGHCLVRRASQQLLIEQALQPLLQALPVG
jgi:hypothetical protein